MSCELPRKTDDNRKSYHQSKPCSDEQHHGHRLAKASLLRAVRIGTVFRGVPGDVPQVLFLSKGNAKHDEGDTDKKNDDEGKDNLATHDATRIKLTSEE